MTFPREFELKLEGGKVVKWEGVDGIDASKRYVGSNPEAVVLAWRYPIHGLFTGLGHIVEPGDWDYNKGGES